MLIIRCVSEPMSLILEPLLLVGPLFFTVSSVCSTVSLQYNQSAVPSVCSTISLQYRQSPVSSVCCAENRTEGTHAGGIIKEEKTCICFIKHTCQFQPGSCHIYNTLEAVFFFIFKHDKSLQLPVLVCTFIYCCSVCQSWLSLLHIIWTSVVIICVVDAPHNTGCKRVSGRLTDMTKETKCSLSHMCYLPFKCMGQGLSLSLLPSNIYQHVSLSVPAMLCPLQLRWCGLILQPWLQGF